MPKNILKKLSISILLSTQIVFLLFFVFLPTTVQAADNLPVWKNPFEDLQVTIPGMDKFSEPAPCIDDPSKTCVKWIGEYISGIYKYAIGVVGILAAVVLMWGGLNWLTAGGNQGRITEAKAWIGASITGLIIALSSYLILYQVNPDLVNFKAIGVATVAGPKVETPTGAISTTGLTEAQASSFLTSAWIKWDKCKAGEPPGCAQLNGIQQSTLSEIDKLAHSCPSCGVDNFYITSGTEGGHADGTYSHGTGYKVDLRLNANVDNFIKNNYKNVGARSDGAIMYYKNESTSIYALEGDHWDVLVCGNGTECFNTKIKPYLN